MPTGTTDEDEWGPDGHGLCGGGRVRNAVCWEATYFYIVADAKIP